MKVVMFVSLVEFFFLRCRDYRLCGLKYECFCFYLCIIICVFLYFMFRYVGIVDVYYFLKSSFFIFVNVFIYFFCLVIGKWFLWFVGSFRLDIICIFIF